MASVCIFLVLHYIFHLATWNQCWIFSGRTDAEDETPILQLPDVKNWLIGKDPDAGKDWRQEEMGMTEDEMVGGHHWPDGHEFEQALGVGYGQGSLAYCSPWGRKESDMTENWTEQNMVPASWASTGHLCTSFLAKKLGTQRVQTGTQTLHRSACVLHFSVVYDSATLQTSARQTPLYLGFSKQEYWSGLPFPSPFP